MALSGFGGLGRSGGARRRGGGGRRRVLRRSRLTRLGRAHLGLMLLALFLGGLGVLLGGLLLALGVLGVLLRGLLLTLGVLSTLLLSGLLLTLRLLGVLLLSRLLLTLRILGVLLLGRLLLTLRLLGVLLLCRLLLTLRLLGVLLLSRLLLTLRILGMLLLSRLLLTLRILGVLLLGRLLLTLRLLGVLLLSRLLLTLRILGVLLLGRLLLTLRLLGVLLLCRLLLVLLLQTLIVRLLARLVLLLALLFSLLLLALLITLLRRGALRRGVVLGVHLHLALLRATAAVRGAHRRGRRPLEVGLAPVVETLGGLLAARPFAVPVAGLLLAVRLVVGTPRVLAAAVGGPLGALGGDLGPAGGPVGRGHGPVVFLMRGPVEGVGPGQIAAGDGGAGVDVAARQHPAVRPVDHHQAGAVVAVGIAAVPHQIWVGRALLVIVVAIAVIDRLGVLHGAVAGLPGVGADPVVVEAVVGRRVLEGVGLVIGLIEIGVVLVGAGRAHDRRGRDGRQGAGPGRTRARRGIGRCQRQGRSGGSLSHRGVGRRAVVGLGAAGFAAGG